MMESTTSTRLSVIGWKKGCNSEAGSWRFSSSKLSRMSHVEPNEAKSKDNYPQEGSTELLSTPPLISLLARVSLGMMKVWMMMVLICMITRPRTKVRISFNWTKKTWGYLSYKRVF